MISTEMSRCRVLEDVEHPVVREDVESYELVVGRDVEEQVGRPLAAVQYAAGVIEGFSRGFKVAAIMILLPCIVPPVPYYRPGSLRVRPSPSSRTLLAGPTLKTSYMEPPLPF